jgi:hypothetical protein
MPHGILGVLQHYPQWTTCISPPGSGVAAIKFTLPLE